MNINKLYSILIFFTASLFATKGFETNFSFESIGKVFNPSIPQEAISRGQGNLASLAKSGDNAVKAASDLVKSTSEAGAALAGAAPTATEKSLNVVSQAIQEVTPVVKVIMAAGAVYELGKEVKSSLLPSKEQQAHAVAVEEYYKAVNAWRDLKACLVENAHVERAPNTGRPVVCEDAARTFALFAGQSYLDEITHTLNTVYPHEKNK